MKRLIGCLAVLGAGLALAMPASAQSMEAKLQKKLAGAWLKVAPWITDYDLARKTAKEQGKPIFGYFTRSYSP